MAVLTGSEIERQVKLGNIKIDPFDPLQLNPNSYDVRLTEMLCVYTRSSGECLDVRERNETERWQIGAEGLVLRPGRVYLGSTIEFVSSDKFVTFIEGKSSLGRLGLTAHVTAGFIDVGFKCNLTLEITVVEPLRIYCKMRIAQLCYSDVVGEISLYAGKYQGQLEAQPSLAWQDFDKKEQS